MLNLNSRFDAFERIYKKLFLINKGFEPEEKKRGETMRYLFFKRGSRLSRFIFILPLFAHKTSSRTEHVTSPPFPHLFSLYNWENFEPVRGAGGHMMEYFFFHFFFSLVSISITIKEPNQAIHQNSTTTTMMRALCLFSLRFASFRFQKLSFYVPCFFVKKRKGKTKNIRDPGSLCSHKWVQTTKKAWNERVLP